MYAAQRPQEGAQSRACPFTAGAMHLPHAIAIVIACPLVLRVIDRGLRQLQPMLPAVLLRRDARCIRRHGFSHNPLAAGLITVADQPTSLFPALATDDMNARRTISLRAALPRLLSGAPPRGSVAVARRRTVFPRRSLRAHRPPTSGRRWFGSAHSPSGWFGAVAATCGPLCRQRGSSPAKRAVDWPLARPGSKSTSVAGRWREPSQAVPLTTV